MNYRPIIIVAGEPNSIFFEIFFKALKTKKFKSPIILVASLNLLKLQMNKLGLQKKIKLINLPQLKKIKLNNRSINLINIKYNQNPVKKGKGSAIFLHLTNKKYKPTNGCIAVLKKDLFKILPYINKKTKIAIT